MANTERWLAGPVENIPPLLQPVAHAMIQAETEIIQIMNGFEESKLWERHRNIASAGFHLKHIRGVLDRLFTYARGEELTTEQLMYLKAEAVENGNIEELLAGISEQIKRSLSQLSQTDESILTEFRGVGRKQIPSTVMGLLFHAAEHTMRHVGQLMVTVRLL